MRWFKRLFLRRRIYGDLSDEIREHLEEKIQEFVQKGMSRKEAAAAARREFGNVGLSEESSREVWRWPSTEDFFMDIRYGLRTLARNPGFAAVAVLTLALGIGANAAIFSLMNALLLRTLPVNNPSQLVLFGEGKWGGIMDELPNRSWQLFSFPFYRQVQGDSSAFSDVTAISSMSSAPHGTIGDSAETEEIYAHLVSGTFFSTLGVNPILGRTFGEDDDRIPGGSPVAVASYAWWKRRFGGAPSIIGEKMSIGSTVYTIIGVTPQEFFGTSVGESPDVWIPLSMEEVLPPGWKGLNDKMFQSLYIIARRRPELSIEQAQTNVNVLFKQAALEMAGSQPAKKQLDGIQHAFIKLTPAASGLSRLRVQFSQPLRALMAAVGLVLLIACANIANLLLARATNRQREIAVRMSMGAGRWRVIRQLLTESFTLAMLGAVLGVALASWASKLLLVMVSGGPETIPVDVGLDSRVLVFVVLVSLATPLLFGMAPAWRAARVELNSSLKQGRNIAAVNSPLARALVVGQVALSLVLLVGAGLFLRTLVNLTNVDMGFDKHNVLVFGIEPASVGYKEDSRLTRLYQEIERRVSAIPGVRAASFSFFTFNQGAWSEDAWTPEESPEAKGNREVVYNKVGRGFFSAMGLKLLSGRTFDQQDSENSPKVAVINETMARLFFPNESPLGRRFRMDGPDAKPENDRIVVGVARDAKYMALKERPWPAAYLPYSQEPGYLWNFEVRYSGDAGSTAPAVRQVIHDVDPRLPVTGAGTLAEQVDHSVVDQRLTAQLSSFFGLVAVFLACIGIYGLMSYAVVHRTNEIGIRVALGAQQGQVLRLIMRQGLVLAASGVAVGIALALIFTRLLRSLLFGVQPFDPVTFIGVAFLLTLIALAACYLPARRAMRVDPVVALRYE
ncbi:MAG: permease [Acidobacteria bacterium]|nr:MAG: permease [Acidobacteriota bacterium]